MKERSKILSLAVVAIILLSLALTACGGGNTQPSNDSKPTENFVTAGAQGSQGDNAQEEDKLSYLNKTGFPIVKEPIKLKMMGSKPAHHGPWEDMMVLNEYEKMTNVQVEYEVVPQAGWREKLNLVLASNELPDAFIRAQLSPMDIAKYGPAGTFIPLEGLVDEYGPNLKTLFTEYSEIKGSTFAPDGHLYCLPGIVTLGAARTDKRWINKIWLDKQGLQVPTTTAELREVLINFRDNDMNGNGDPKDEIPMTMRNLDHIVNIFAGSFGLDVQMGYKIKIENDKVNIWLDDDRYKDLLMYINDLYENKLLDNEALSHEQAQFLSKMDSNKTGVFVIQTDNTFSNYRNDYVAMPVWKGPNGDQLVTPASPVARDFGTFAITNVNKYPEATMRWIDYFYGKEGSIFFRMGIEGDTYMKNADGTYDYTDKIKNDPRGTSVAIGQMTIWPGGGAPHWINDENSVAVNSPITQAAQELLNPNMPAKVYSPPIFDLETQQEISTIKYDIDNYFAETSSKFIVGELSFDKWEEYVSTLKDIGIEELERVYQEAYDKMK